MVTEVVEYGVTEVDSSVGVEYGVLSRGELFSAVGVGAGREASNYDLMLVINLLPEKQF
jgi:hypothetical protein